MSNKVAQRPAGQAGVDSTESWMEVTYTFTNGWGYLKLDYFIDAEATFDKLIVYVDSVERVSFSVASHFDHWEGYLLVSPGGGNLGQTNTVRIAYQKNGSTSFGTDNAWVDNVVIQNHISSPSGGSVTDLLNDTFESDTIGSAPVGWTVGGSSGGWVVAAESTGLFIVKTAPSRTLSTNVIVTFSESVNTTANTSTNYTIPGLTVSAAAIISGTGNTQVLLTTTAMTPSTVYTLTVVNVQDTATSTAIVAPQDTSIFDSFGFGARPVSLGVLDGSPAGAHSYVFGTSISPGVQDGTNNRHDEGYLGRIAAAATGGAAVVVPGSRGKGGTRFNAGMD